MRMETFLPGRIRGEVTLGLNQLVLGMVRLWGLKVLCILGEERIAPMDQESSGRKAQKVSKQTEWRGPFRVP